MGQMKRKTFLFYLICILSSTKPTIGCQQIEIFIKRGTYPGEVTWGVEDLNGTNTSNIYANIYGTNTYVSGTGFTQYKRSCLSVGSYRAWGIDSYGDSWNGAEISISGCMMNYLSRWTGPTYTDNQNKVTTILLIVLVTSSVFA